MQIGKMGMRPESRMHIRMCDVMMCQYLQNVMNAPNSDFPRVQPINEIRGKGSFVKRRITLMLWRACQSADGRVYTALCVASTQSRDSRVVGSRQSIIRV